jgi:hypothetical protein
MLVNMFSTTVILRALSTGMTWRSLLNVGYDISLLDVLNLPSCEPGASHRQQREEDDFLQRQRKRLR